MILPDPQSQRNAHAENFWEPYYLSEILAIAAGVLILIEK
jgi:hypothetical protein